MLEVDCKKIGSEAVFVEVMTQIDALGAVFSAVMTQIDAPGAVFSAVMTQIDAPRAVFFGIDPEKISNVRL